MVTVTKDDIKAGLSQVGLSAGCKVLVHSALSRFGYVEGGADAVIDALLEVVGLAGTVLVPTLTGDESLSPANPPTFDPALTSCWTGTIPETFRKRPNAVRSLHPTHSAAAIGADAVALTQDHIRSVTPCDEFSPYGRLAQYAESTILLLGVDHEANTTFHYVEELAGVTYHMQAGFAKATLHINGDTLTRHIMLHSYDTPRQFNIMDPLLSERGIQKMTRIGGADVRLVHVQSFVQITLQCLRADQRVLCQR